MTRTTMLASLALTMIALLGLPVLAFQRMGLIDFAPAPTPDVAVLERPFLAEGVALVEVPKPEPFPGDGSENAELSALMAAAEPRVRILHVEVDEAKLGSFAGVVNDALLGKSCHLGTGELRSTDGDTIRVALRIKSAADSCGPVGSYTITGGTGKFQHASGRGALHTEIDGKRPQEMLTLTLDGTISY